MMTGVSFSQNERRKKMSGKTYTHEVTVASRHRDNRKSQSEGRGNAAPKQAVKLTFDAYYRDQVRALYRAVCREK